MNYSIFSHLVHVEANIKTMTRKTEKKNNVFAVWTGPVTTGRVRRQLERLHQWKAAGPDGISPRILKTCASQLSPVLQHLYNLSLGQERKPHVLPGSCSKEIDTMRPQ